MSYQDVQAELGRGTSPAVLCATCPWDRMCIQPPKIDHREGTRQIEEATTKDLADDPTRSKLPMGALLTALTVSLQTDAARVCPVFAAKLRSPEGRVIADSIRVQMRGE